MKEGVPRYVPQIAFMGRDGTLTFRQKRTIDGEAVYLCSPQHVPLHVQDAIAAAVDIQVTRSLIGLFRFCTRQSEQREEKYNTERAFRSLQKILKPMEKFQGQNHESILSNIMGEMDSMVRERGRIGNISGVASSYGILTPLALFARIKADHLKGAILAMFPERAELKSLPPQQHEIIATAAYFTQWEALREAKVPGYLGDNPFEPLLILIENGNVGIAVDILNGRSVYQTKPYMEKPLTDIGPILAA